MGKDFTIVFYFYFLCTAGGSIFACSGMTFEFGGAGATRLGKSWFFYIFLFIYLFIYIQFIIIHYKMNYLCFFYFMSSSGYRVHELLSLFGLYIHEYPL